MMFLALLACLPAGLGADETDGVAEPEVAAFASSPAPPLEGPDTGSPTAGAGPLSVMVDGSSADVVHSFQDTCGAEFRGATAAVQERTITMTYLLDAGNDDAPCDWVLAYTLSGLTAGDWTLRAREDAVDFTVEP
jgi:hypothetical protein